MTKHPQMPKMECVVDSFSEGKVRSLYTSKSNAVHILMQDFRLIMLEQPRENSGYASDFPSETSPSSFELSGKTGHEAISHFRTQGDTIAL